MCLVDAQDLIEMHQRVAHLRQQSPASVEVYQQEQEILAFSCRILERQFAQTLSMLDVIPHLRVCAPGKRMDHDLERLVRALAAKLDECKSPNVHRHCRRRAGIGRVFQ